MNVNKNITLATEKYVDDTILETQSDWEQSDSSKPDFIKNKTHYDLRESGGELKRLDKKYIPKDTVYCNSAKVGETIVVKSVDENGVPTEWKTAEVQSSRDYLILKNKDGYEFIVYINGETLSSKMVLQEIKAIKLPDKTDYTDTELFDPTGMVIIGVSPTGKEEMITNYTYDRFVTTGSDSHIVTYVDEIGNIYTVGIPITTRTLKDALKDFYYNSNSDGTYTITGWKKTFNGVLNTKFVVPNSELVNI